MKGILIRSFGDPDVLRLEELNDLVPSGNQVLVRVKAIGVNPVETYIRSGNYPALPELPYTPGKDAAGVVEAVGSDVTRWKTGDSVYTAGSISGTYAEYTLVDELDLGALPDHVAFDQGACLWTPYATAYRALFQKASASTDDLVLIHGASGGVGLAAVQWCKQKGIRVFGTASTAEGRELVLQQGANAVFDHSAENYLEEIDHAARPGGVTVIIEMLANKNLQSDFQVLARFGRIVVVGNRGSLDFNPRVIMGKDASIFGMTLFNSSYAERQVIHTAIYEGLQHGALKPVISHTFPLAEAAAAHHEVIEGKAAGKIVLIPS
jgi:NADPH:quinone reductase